MFGQMPLGGAPFWLGGVACLVLFIGLMVAMIGAAAENLGVVVIGILFMSFGFVGLITAPDPPEAPLADAEVIDGRILLLHDDGNQEVRVQADTIASYRPFLNGTEIFQKHHAVNFLAPDTGRVVVRESPSRLDALMVQVGDRQSGGSHQ